MLSNFTIQLGFQPSFSHRLPVWCLIFFKLLFFLIYSSRLIDEEIPLNTNILSLLVSSVEQQ